MILLHILQRNVSTGTELSCQPSSVMRIRRSRPCPFPFMFIMRSVAYVTMELYVVRELPKFVL